jgi:aspartokinase-like uncharacterized kinase
MTEPLVVVKVGGSLYDLDDLGARLQQVLAPLRAYLIVPGGGSLVECLRRLDQVHQLGEETCHWLALRALSLNARLLCRLLPGSAVADDIAPGRHILDPHPFCLRDEECDDRLPHCWDVSSDSLALHIAVRAGAAELLLLKSRDWDVCRPWLDAVGAGVVDAHFPTVRRRHEAMPIRVVNLRQAPSARGSSQS